MSTEHKGKLLKDKKKNGNLIKDDKNGELLKDEVPEGKKIWIDDNLNEENIKKKKLNE